MANWWRTKFSISLLNMQCTLYIHTPLCILMKSRVCSAFCPVCSLCCVYRMCFCLYPPFKYACKRFADFPATTYSWYHIYNIILRCMVTNNDEYASIANTFKPFFHIAYANSGRSNRYASVIYTKKFNNAFLKFYALNLSIKSTHFILPWSIHCAFCHCENSLCFRYKFLQCIVPLLIHLHKNPQIRLSQV